MTIVDSSTILDSSVWESQIFIAGWRRGSAGSRDVIEPATGKALGSVGVAGTDDVAEAVRVAAAAQRDWAAVSPGQRAAVLRRAGDLWAEHADEIGDWITREAGSIPPKAGLETHIAADECWDASALPHLPAGEVLASDEPRWSMARRRPAGVVGVIAPFNFPLILSIRAVAPALALGNAVVLKPDPRTAVCGGVALVRVFEEAGLPAGLLSLVTGGADVGEALVRAPEVRVVAFTGSTAAGRAVGALAGETLTRAHLELGGNNALVVLPGADVQKASSAGAFGSFMHQGQICMTTGRHLVHVSQYAEYVEALAARADALPVGDPATEQVALGPIIDDGQASRVRSIIDAAVAAGARIAAGGTNDGLFFRPTVLADLTEDNPAWRQEIFGPVAPVLAYEDLDDVVRIVNSSEYGLSVGLLGDVGIAMGLADRIESGKVHINEQTVSDESQAPFGGVRDSGNGARAGGAAANIEAFTETQWVTLRSDIAPYPF